MLDEIHRVPELFATLRGLIDQGRRRGRKTGRFLEHLQHYCRCADRAATAGSGEPCSYAILENALLLGSASMDLLRQSGESLAGRIARVDLGPLNVLETAAIRELWVRGGFPDSFTAKKDRDSMMWRKDFIRTCLERDIPEFGPRVPAETLERLWTMLDHNQGGILNASQLAAAMMISAQSTIDLMVDLLLVRRLQPFHPNVGKRIVKSPKVYVRDSGLLHALLGIGDYNVLSGHPAVGMSWEGFVIENLLAAAPPLTIPSFYRTGGGAEIDLLLEVPGLGTCIRSGKESRRLAWKRWPRCSRSCSA